jgi:hypothetical protein
MNATRTAAAVALTLAASAARAEHDFSGLFDAQSAYRTRTGGPSGHGDQYTAGGAILFTLDNPGIAVQADGGETAIASGKGVEQVRTAGGDLFWRDAKGTFGLSGSYVQSDATSLPYFSEKTALENAGLFGEYYAGRALTLEIKGGVTTGSNRSTGYFGGGGFTYYDYSDLSLHAEGNFSGFRGGRDWSDAEARVEYLPFSALPVSVYGGYDWSHFSHNGSISTVFVGLRVHLGPGKTLEEYDRHGPITWTGRATAGTGLKL